ncbi:hypothetical protein LOAG_09047 [Loa loa]|uniref:Uncharacterized protein n=1 Tax=Loa loa TaxID=7209 RepID=A0A1S0TSM7_LOALO|nr:hypothetical protein LOAG_09047 [Loa loa]EFO19447.1 hypothetical protein LOAG_09047 [Loa loa]
MSYFLLIFLIFYQLQKNNAGEEILSTPSAAEAGAGSKFYFNTLNICSIVMDLISQSVCITAPVCFKFSFFFINLEPIMVQDRVEDSICHVSGVDHNDVNLTGVTGSGILTTTKGTQCLIPLTAFPGWLAFTSILYEMLTHASYLLMVVRKYVQQNCAPFFRNWFMMLSFEPFCMIHSPLSISMAQTTGCIQ